jgi:phosphoglycerate dehydrogenase-like enzyme
MTTTDTPLVLLWINDAGPYRQALTEVRLDARVEVIHVPLTEELTPDLLARGAAMLAFRAGPGLLGRMPRLCWLEALTEPLPAEHPFWSTAGITVLPHIGGLHPGRDHSVAALFADNLERFLAGRPLRETVDRARGY